MNDIEPAIYFPGPIPDALRQYHLENPLVRQSESTLNGQVNPEERSQYYIGIQRNFIREVYQIHDINVLQSGNIWDIQNYLKANYDQSRDNNSDARKKEMDEKEYETICYSFMNRLS